MLKIKKVPVPSDVYFCKILKMREKILLIRQLFFFYIVQVENGDAHG